MEDRLPTRRRRRFGVIRQGYPKMGRRGRRSPVALQGRGHDPATQCCSRLCRPRPSAQKLSAAQGPSRLNILVRRASIAPHGPEACSRSTRVAIAPKRMRSNDERRMSSSPKINLAYVVNAPTKASAAEANKTDNPNGWLNEAAQVIARHRHHHGDRFHQTCAASSSKASASTLSRSREATSHSRGTSSRFARRQRRA
jgi:hypothetical protein